MRIDRRQLYGSRWDGLVRLARWRGFRVRQGSDSLLRRIRLVEALIRDMDREFALGNRPPIVGAGTVRPTRLDATS